MGKQMINTSLSTTTAYTSGTLPLGSAKHGIGCGLKLSGNSILITEPGMYRILVSMTFQPTGTGAVELDVLDNGNVIASASETPAAASADINLSTIGAVYKVCKCQGADAITFTASAAGNLTDMFVIVERM